MKQISEIDRLSDYIIENPRIWDMVTGFQKTVSIILKPHVPPTQYV